MIGEQFFMLEIAKNYVDVICLNNITIYHTFCAAPRLCSWLSVSSLIFAMEWCIIINCMK